MNRIFLYVFVFKHSHEIFSSSSTLFSIFFKVFDCVCFVHILKSDMPKLDLTALKCMFLGYALSQNGYKCDHLLTY